MAKPEPVKLSSDDWAAIRKIKDELDRGDFDNYEDPNPTRGLTPQKIVKAYKESGEFINLDWPGGIEQFVKDYEAGKFDA